MVRMLIDHYADGSTTAFANMLGVKPQTISTWIKRKSFDIELIFAKCEYISADWLLTGEGNMLKEEVKEPVQEGECQSSADKERKIKELERTIAEKERTIAALELAIKAQETAIATLQNKAF